METKWPRPTRPEWVAIVLATAMLAAAVVADIASHGRLDEATAHSASIRMQAARSHADTKPTLSVKQVQELNAAVQRLNVPAIALLSAVTAPKAIGISLISLELRPDAGTGSGSISLAAEASGPYAMIEYLDLLNARARLYDVELVKHEQSSGGALRLELRAKWRQEP